MNIWDKEPALILSAVNALLALAVGFGAPVTPQQAALINAAVAAIIGVATRAHVVPASGASAQMVDLTKVGKS